MFKKENAIIPFGVISLLANIPAPIPVRLVFLGVGLLGFVYQILCLTIGK